MRLSHVLLVLILWCAPSIIDAQTVLKGQVTSEDGMPLPGVRVFIAQTTYGVITDYTGHYFLELKGQEEYHISFNMVGMKDTVMTIDGKLSRVSLDVVLLASDTELNTVDVYADRVDMAKKIIKQVQANRKGMREQFKGYTCKTYQVTKIQKEAIGMPDSILERQPDYMKAYLTEIDLLETYSNLIHQSPNNFVENVLACHDYVSTNPNVLFTGENVSQFVHHDLQPIQHIEVNPYVFLNTVANGNIDLYQNMVNLPKVTEYPITSPIGLQAFINYRFQLKSTFIEAGHKVYEIEVIPKFKKAPLFSGTLFIIDEAWVIKSFNLSINSSVLSFFDDITCIQDYENMNGFWVPVRREFIYTITDGFIKHTGNTRVNHSAYLFNQKNANVSDLNQLLSFEKNAFDRDRAYWDSIRPMALKTEELKFIELKIQKEVYKNSRVYQDSVDAVQNKISFWDIAIWGINRRNRARGMTYYFSSPFVGAINPVGVGGFRYAYNIGVNKTFDNAHEIKTSTWLNYGFYNQDLRGRMRVGYTYLPKRFGELIFEAGNVYDLISYYNSIQGTFSRGNFVQKRFVQIGQSIEIVNGLYGKLNLSFSDRSAITGLKLSDWSKKLFGDLNEPEPFDRYKIAMIDLRLSYQFKQQYEIKGNKKYIIGSKYPTLELTYKKGIPDLFDSEVNFDFIELGISDRIDLGNYGKSKWRAITGSFVNEESLRFMEHKFFRGSDTWYFSNPLYSHQLLDSTFHTPKPYVQAFFIHHFNGLVMNKIPLVNYLKLELSAGGSLLVIQDANYIHSEFYFGLDKKFKIQKQRVKLILYGVTRVNNMAQTTFEFKFGFGLFNSYTNEWTN